MFVLCRQPYLRKKSCRPYFIVIQIWLGIIFMRFKNGKIGNLEIESEIVVETVA
jgi:hypothetical protein